MWRCVNALCEQREFCYTYCNHGTQFFRGEPDRHNCPYFIPLYKTGQRGSIIKRELTFQKKN